MQGGHLTIAKPNFPQVSATSKSANAGDWLTRVFGCWHREMSRPFSRQGEAYRSCLKCGAQRKFNVGKWEMQGGYYFSVENRTQLAVN